MAGSGLPWQDAVQSPIIEMTIDTTVEYNNTSTVADLRYIRVSQNLRGNVENLDLVSTERARLTYVNLGRS